MQLATFSASILEKASSRTTRRMVGFLLTLGEQIDAVGLGKAGQKRHIQGILPLSAGILLDHLAQDRCS